MAMSWSLDPPRSDEHRPQKIESARRYLKTGHHRKFPAAEQTKNALRNYRLKQPWLTVCKPGYHNSLRLYLNFPARRLVVKREYLTTTLYATLDTENDELILDRNMGGHPLVLVNDAQTYNRTICAQMVAHGYDHHDRTYYPITRLGRSLIVDLSRPYTKRQAMAKEENDRCEARATKSRRERAS